MNFYLILYITTSIILYLIWLGWNYLKALGKAYGNANPALGPGNINHIFVIVAFLLLSSILLSISAPNINIKKIIFIPIVLIFIGEGYILCREFKNGKKYLKKSTEIVLLLESKIKNISKDYLLLEEDLFLGIKSSFLTHDKDLNILIRIDVDHKIGFLVFGFGRINGPYLEIFKEENPSVYEFYKNYRDKDNKSVFDKYKISYKPDLDLDYQDILEDKYKI